MSDSRRTEGAESELALLRKHATELARERKERATSVHLLAAMSVRTGPVADLLSERHLGGEALLKAGRSFDEDDSDAMTRCLVEAREMAKRTRRQGAQLDGARGISPTSSVDPSGVHLLLAILADRRLAAHRALLQCGIDLGRLRAAALQVAIGFVAPRRPVALRAPGATVAVAVPRVSETPKPPSSPPPERKAAVVPLRPVATVTAVVVPTPLSARPEKPSHVARHASDARRGSHRRSPAKKAAAPIVPSTDMASLRALAAVGRDLSARARSGAYDHIVGREDEVERALDVLSRESQHAACFVGPTGAGTTSTVHALSKRLADEGSLVVELSIAALLSGNGPRAQISAIREELAASGAIAKLVLVVDDLHEIASFGDDAIAELRLVCSIPGVSFVAATSDGGYRRLAECAPLFARLLSAIEVEEPNVEDTFLMVRSRSALLEKHHDVRFTDEAVAAAIGWTKRYVPGVALPAKALGALDLAGARAKRRGDLPRAVVSESQVADVVAELGDIPVERLREADADRMLALEAELGKRVIGHEKALGRIARHVRRNAAGLRGDRPIGSFLLLGPTGVGKTETAKALAATLFGAPTAMTRVDMSEYAEAHAVARLIGAPPGYVGHEAGGQLTEAVRKRPYQVVLLDEIEKAHRDVLQAFLQVLDEGHLTDGRGRRVDFTNALIVLTSNLGAREVEAERSKRAVGFASSAPASAEKLEQTSVQAARKDLPPELFNRIDEVLFFAPLERTEVVAIARLLLGELEKRLAQRGVRMEVDAAALDTLLDHGGFDASLGARPMRRAIERLVEAPIADLILRGDVRDGSVVLVGADDGVLTIDSVDAPRGRRAEGLARASASV